MKFKITLLLTLCAFAVRAQLTIYQNSDQSGTQATAAVRTIYAGSSIPGGMNDGFASFTLRQGYMATLAENEDGSGFGFSYVATVSNLAVNLPAKLSNKVSFIRVLPIRNVLKKGAGGSIDGLDVSWFYSWGAKFRSTDTKEYVLMSWGRNGANTSAKIDEYIARDTITHLLSFNEPDHAGQSNIPYTEAVPLHKNLLRTGYRIGSPATTQGQATKWLSNFMNKAKQDTVRVDFIAVHWYDWGHWGSTNETSPDPAGVFNRFKNYLTNIYNLYKKPIWVTEFNANRNTTAQTHADFLALALPWLDAQPFIERYAFFFPPTVPAIEDGALSAVAQVYNDHISAPAFSENQVYTEDTETLPSNLGLIPISNELVMPQYAYAGGVKDTRLHYLCKLKLTGLKPNATYRYFTGLSSIPDEITQTPGWMLAIHNTSGADGYMVGMSSTNKSINGSKLANNENFSGSGSKYDTFETNASGNYTGWFSVIPTDHAKHSVGSNAYFYVQVNNGSGGKSLDYSFRTTSTIAMLDYSTTPEDEEGASAITGISVAGNEKIVSLYDNTTLSGRPLYTTFTENDGIPQPYTNWYGAVNAANGSWGAIVPNDLSNGIQAIEVSDIDGTQLSLNIRNDGKWGSTETIHPTNGSTPITINAESTLPITLSAFSGKSSATGIQLQWQTSQEINNNYFELLHANENQAFKPVAKINGANNSSEIRHYSYTDYRPVTGTNYYRLKQVDRDGNSTTSPTIAVAFGLTAENLKITSVSSNRINGSITLPHAQKGQILYTDMTGQVLYRTSQVFQQGLNNFTIPVAGLPGEIAIITYLSETGKKSVKLMR